MSFSYSLHLSNEGNAITTLNRLARASRHNLRNYQSNEYDRNTIVILQGSPDSIVKDVKELYHQEFDEVLKKYNEGKRADRQIKDYLQHVSDKKVTDIAVEIILQVGDKEFWKDKTDEERRIMTEIFKSQIDELKKLCPELKIASVVIHYEEQSPHCHIVGVPVHEGYKKGLEKQVSKTKVFTRESLEMLQSKMREHVLEQMKGKEIFRDAHLKDKEKGRNKDIPKKYLAEFYEKEAAAKEQLLKTQETLSNNQLELQEQDFEMWTNRNTLDEQKSKIEGLNERIRQQHEQRACLDNELMVVNKEVVSKRQQLDDLGNELDQAKKTIAPQIKAYETISKGAREHDVPQLEIGEERTWFSSHTENFVKIPVENKEMAQKTIDEINALYSKQFTENSLNELVNENNNRISKKRAKLRKDMQQLEDAKQRFEVEREDRIKETEVYKELSGYTINEEELSKYMDKTVGKKIVYATVDATLDYLEKSGVEIPPHVHMNLLQNRERIFFKILDRICEFIHEAKTRVMDELVHLTRGSRGRDELER